jgi:hypothetical protein
MGTAIWSFYGGFGDGISRFRAASRWARLAHVNQNCISVRAICASKYEIYEYRESGVLEGFWAGSPSYGSPAAGALSIRSLACDKVPSEQKSALFALRNANKVLQHTHSSQRAGFKKDASAQASRTSL